MVVIILTMKRNLTLNQKINVKTIELFHKIAAVMAPPPMLKVSEWADEYRRLSPEASAEPGRWNTDRAPYQRDIMNAINDTECEEVVVMSSAQVGKSEIVLNILGYYIDYDPAPIMIMQPTLEMAQAFSKDRLSTMIRDTPALKEKMSDSKSKDGDNTILHKKFPGGQVTIVGANSAAGLASRPIRILLCDEVDRYPESAGTEGDPIGLAVKRANTFWNRKKVYVSTPTIKNISRIEQEYSDSTMEQWCVACPCCGSMQPYEWGRINHEDVTMTCRDCDERFNEMDWKQQPGIWVAQHPERVHKRGFHLNELASPWKHWEEVIKDFKTAMKVKKKTGSIEQLKVFINTSLGETWEEKGEGEEDETLLGRRENYSADLQKGVTVLTAGVDIQDNRFEIEVVGWRKGYESWGVEYHKIFCDPDKEESWDKLEVYLDKEFFFEDGSSLLIAATCIDTGGHFTTKAYKWLKKMEKKHKRIYGIKGMGGDGIPLIHKVSKNNQEKVKIFILGVNQGKEMIMARLKTKEKGPGYCHFPLDKSKHYDENYIKGLNSERRLLRYVKGKPRFEWVKKSGVRNEPLDLRNYATAAVEILAPNWDALEEKIEQGINYMKVKKIQGPQRTKKRGVVNKGVNV